MSCATSTSPHQADFMRLNLQILSSLPANVQRPSPSATGANVGIVHLGIGAFHRAHQAVYPTTRWRWLVVTGDFWRQPEVANRAGSIGGAGWAVLSVRTVSRESDAWRVVGSVREVLFAPSSCAEVIARIARAGTQIVSLTVTEKGYCANVASASRCGITPILRTTWRMPMHSQRARRSRRRSA